jgi:hypothetical protein
MKVLKGPWNESFRNDPTKIMKIQVDLKSAAFGLAVGLAVLLIICICQRNGRYLATMNSNGFIIVTDTQTGHVWVNRWFTVSEKGRWDASHTLPVKSAIWTPPSDLLDQIAATNAQPNTLSRDQADAFLDKTNPFDQFDKSPSTGR